MAKVRPGGHGSYHPIGFEGREDTSTSRTFFCSGFAEAIASATDETIDDVRKAMASTMNKVLKSVRTMVSSEIRKRYNVPKAILDARLDLFEGRVNKDLQAVLTVGGKSVSLSYFGAKQFEGNQVKTRTKSTVKKSFTKTPGVQVEVIKGRRTVLKSAWLATFRSGHIGILTRRGKDRYPISVKSAISIASMFEQVEVNDAVVAKIDADLEATFFHEMEFYLGRGGQ
jgi:hypothetical protein